MMWIFKVVETQAQIVGISDLKVCVSVLKETCTKMRSEGKEKSAYKLVESPFRRFPWEALKNTKKFEVLSMKGRKRKNIQ